MPPLERSFRRQLDQCVRRARAIAEDATRKALGASSPITELDAGEYAFRYWHEMLTARYRTENGAPSEQEDGKTVSPMPPETRRELETLLATLPPEIFHAEDSLGWAYQCWQAETKAAINRAGGKIGAEALPAVTQLFTHDYMVLFLLHNTLGAWWAGKVLAADPALAREASDEDTLRAACAVNGVQWSYLRFIRTESAPLLWLPAAGTFAGWPRQAKNLTILDPCMGSGHFLVLALPILTAMRRAEEGLDSSAAIEAVLRDNLFGLELDDRCTQIAMLNLSLAAWRQMGGYRPLPALNLACTGHPLECLHALFTKAPWLGSLVAPRRFLEKDRDREGAISGVFPEAIRLLDRSYTLVATNVPYLARRKQDRTLQDFCEQAYPDAKADLATCFIERCRDFCQDGGSMALVTPQNWLFLKSYARLRAKLLDTLTWNTVVWLGEKAFDSAQAAGAFSALFIASKIPPSVDHVFAGLDVQIADQPDDKETALVSDSFMRFEQAAQAQNPDSRLSLAGSAGALLSTWFVSHAGVQTGDVPRFMIRYWELPCVRYPWIFHQVNPDTTTAYDGLNALMRWEDGCGAMSRSENARIQGTSAFGKQGILVCHMRQLKCARYLGFGYDNNSAVLLPKDPAHLPALWAFVSSPQYNESVRAIDQKLNVTPATLAKVPFDIEYGKKVAKEEFPNGLPPPYSSDPAQWIFNGHPKGATHPLQVAVARLLGYRWPRQTGSIFPDCPALDSDGLEAFADSEGILCLHASGGQAPAAQRIEALLAAAYGTQWTGALLERLLAGVGYAGKNLEVWLRDGFFRQHCALFRQRPFLWHIWDGRRDGFHAIVNYHRLAEGDGAGRKLLEKLICVHLDAWIEQLRNSPAARAEASIRLRERLIAILEGEPPYDLFVRWKPLREQPIGWDPDLDDGVRINIRPFMMPHPGTTRKRDNGVLRIPPKIRWDKDRGSEAYCAGEDFPWFWDGNSSGSDLTGGSTFTGIRRNDFHHSPSEKRAARGK